MTEENKQSSSDDAAGKTARKKGAIKGGLLGLGPVLLTAAASVAIGITDWNTLLVFAFLLTAMGATLGWNLPGAIIGEAEREAREQIPWKRSAAIGALMGMATIIYLFVLPPVATVGVMNITKEILMVALISLTLFAPAGAFLFAIVHVVLLHPASRRGKTIKFLGWSLGAVACFYLVVLAINLRDEELLPDAKKVLESRGFTVKPEDNAFFVIAGFGAPKGEDPHAFGRKRVAFWEEQEKKTNARERNFDEKPLYGGESRSSGVPLRELDNICDWSKRPCLEAMAGSREIVARYLAENPEWVARYHGLLQLPRFEEHIPAVAQTPVPHYHQALNISRLRKAQCAVLVADGKTAECLDILAEDIGLARRMLAGARTLIGKSAAATALGRDHAVLSEVLTAQPAVARQAAARMRELLAPLGSLEMDATRALQSELHLWRTAFADMRSGGYSLAEFFLDTQGVLLGTASLAALPTLQVNANINYYWRYLALTIDHFGRPADRYQAETAVFIDKLKAVEPDMSFPAILYNPHGKWLHAIALPAFETYKVRLNDLDGRQRLVRLQWKLVEQQVPVDQVGDFIAKAGAQYHDPYTNKPMAWDVGTRTLSVVGRPTMERTVRYEAKL